MEDQLLAENLTCSRSNPNDQKVEPSHLLEDSWFFGNLLETKTKTMNRCMSNPSPSSSPISNSKPSSPRTPPLEKIKKKLIRNQERPREEDPDNEFALSRLIRQASLTSSDVFLPPKNKANKKNQNAPSRVQCKSIEEKIQQVQKQKPILRKCVSNLGVEVGIFDKKDDLFTQTDNKQKSRITAWKKGHISNFDHHPQVPNWLDKESSTEDVKAQIKFWARSVAANVR
ncbi:uncharacterized protein LOC124910714 [Impatiens glandulifera]|uniref:uncharacterized protein LOC124910714 n=1 Tax=Impatiens glandulifera TaxID=253017 RepID=UPI001FB15E5E|nr:uncharacterized protein LOC124910714 [Impatiens glandulifera]